MTVSRYLPPHEICRKRFSFASNISQAHAPSRTHRRRIKKKKEKERKSPNRPPFCPPDDRSLAFRFFEKNLKLDFTSISYSVQSIYKSFPSLQILQLRIRGLYKALK